LTRDIINNDGDQQQYRLINLHLLKKRMEAKLILNSLQDLLDLNTSQFSSAESELKTKLLEWANVASSMQLKMSLKKYIGFTIQHLQRMDAFLEQEKILSVDRTNTIMLAFISSIEEKLQACTTPEIKDACILAGVQSICHFKISSYGTAAAFARLVGLTEFANVFYESEVNEKHVDDELTQLAAYEINTNALTPLNLT
jgi:ferritin-like metal-binding protein YciE